MSQSTPLFDIQDLGEKGKGVVARVDIPVGTRIMSEKPLFTVTKNPQVRVDSTIFSKIIAAKLQTLSVEKQRQFLSLHDRFRPSDTPAFVGTYMTNCIPCDDIDRLSGIFLNVCRINHSCIPNAIYSWHEEKGVENVHAIQSIKAGEEITVSYIPHYSPVADRQADLQRMFGFLCNCHGCVRPQTELKESDDRRRQLGRLVKAFSNPDSDPLVRLKNCHSRLVLLRREFEESSDLTGIVYYDAYHIFIASGDVARASVCAERAHATTVISMGEDSSTATTLKDLAADPRVIKTGKRYSAWKSTKEDIPKTKDKTRMETWLWERVR